VHVAARAICGAVLVDDEGGIGDRDIEAGLDGRHGVALVRRRRDAGMGGVDPRQAQRGAVDVHQFDRRIWQRHPGDDPADSSSRADVDEPGDAIAGGQFRHQEVGEADAVRSEEYGLVGRGGIGRMQEQLPANAARPDLADQPGGGVAEQPRPRHQFQDFGTDHGRVEGQAPPEHAAKVARRAHRRARHDAPVRFGRRRGECVIGSVQRVQQGQRRLLGVGQCHRRRRVRQTDDLASGMVRQ
jgi:hypothetical protein